MIMFVCPKCNKNFDAPGMDPYLLATCPECGFDWQLPKGEVCADVAELSAGKPAADLPVGGGPIVETPAVVEIPTGVNNTVVEPETVKSQTVVKPFQRPGGGRTLLPGIPPTMGRVLPTAGDTAPSRSAATLDKLLSVRPAAAKTPIIPPTANQPQTTPAVPAEPPSPPAKVDAPLPVTQPIAPLPVAEPVIAPAIVAMSATPSIVPSPDIKPVIAPATIKLAPAVIKPSQMPTLQPAPVQSSKTSSSWKSIVATIFIIFGVLGLIAGLLDSITSAITGAVFTLAAIVLLVIERISARHVG